VSKLRALYKWLAVQNVEEYHIEKDPPADSALYHLLLVRAKRKNLNHVLQLMCKYVCLEIKYMLLRTVFYCKLNHFFGGFFPSTFYCLNSYYMCIV
jgi:hypothetical protein